MSHHRLAAILVAEQLIPAVELVILTHPCVDGIVRHVTGQQHGAQRFTVAVFLAYRRTQHNGYTAEILRKLFRVSRIFEQRFHLVYALAVVAFQGIAIVDKVKLIHA